MYTHKNISVQVSYNKSYIISNKWHINTNLNKINKEVNSHEPELIFMDKINVDRKLIWN